VTPTITVAIFGPLPGLVPLAEFSIGPSVSSATVSEQLPGGLDRLQLSYDATSSGVRAVVPTPPVLIDGSHIVVYADSAVMFEGTVTSWQPGQLEAQGYGTWALGWGSVGQGGDEQVTSGVMAAMILHSNPWLVPTQLIDPGVMHAASEMTNKAPIDVLRQFCTEGGTYDDEQYEWMFVVGPDRLTRFVPMAPPVTPDHVLSYDPDTMAITWNMNNVDAVSIAYQENGQQVTSGPYYRGGFDRTSSYVRHKMLTSGDQQPSGAIAYALTQLAKLSTPQLSGTLLYTNWEGRGKHAGDSVRIPGIIESDDLATAYITSVNHDLVSGGSNVTLGEPMATPLAFLRRLAQGDIAARRNLHPETWSKTA
jgi:hypothetical protein